MRFVKSFMLIVFAWLILFAPAQVSADATTVILVRHGETPYNKVKRYQGHLDIPLNEVGIKQAKLLAKASRIIPLTFSFQARSAALT